MLQGFRLVALELRPFGLLKMCGPISMALFTGSVNAYPCCVLPAALHCTGDTMKVGPGETSPALPLTSTWQVTRSPDPPKYVGAVLYPGGAGVIAMTLHFTLTNVPTVKSLLKMSFSIVLTAADMFSPINPWYSCDLRATRRGAHLSLPLQV